MAITREDINAAVVKGLIDIGVTPSGKDVKPITDHVMDVIEPPKQQPPAPSQPGRSPSPAMLEQLKSIKAR